VLVRAWGEDALFYNPANALKRGVYIMTVKRKDGNNDKASALDRAGIFRLNAGIRPKHFAALFGAIPGRPAAGGVVDMPFDFTQTDVILPHPVYAWMGWVCVLNPSDETFGRFLPLIDEAYECAKEKFAKRVKAL
jgi:hypothetical protein